MKNILIPLMQEYQRLMEVENKFNDWKKENPELYSWDYKGQRASKAQFERMGIMIRKIMIDYERNYNQQED